MDNSVLRCITLGTRPFIHSNTICDFLSVSDEKWLGWVMDTQYNSVAMVRTPDGLFVEESGASLLIENKCTPELYLRWKRWVTNRNIKRRLTEAEKKAVAAEQHWHCAMCNQLFQYYEVDHIEQYCIRGNNSRKNLQALCSSCHSRKTRQDREYGDALFETQLKQSTNLHGGGGNVFSGYFYRQEENPNS